MHSYIKRHAQSSDGSWAVPALCQAYHWPSELAGGGIIGIVELGGGWTASDVAAFFKGIGQPEPTITDVSVDGTQNSQQSPQSGDDYEVALDIQVAGASYFCATGKPANIRIYWSQNINTAIAMAAADGCSVFSCSWGNDEAAIGAAGCELIENAAAAATAAGMACFAASGDNDSSDGGPTPANVDNPASCPHFIGCGGTTKTSTEEVAWNNNPGNTDGEGTGGGYSTIFPKQDWQIGAPLEPEPPSSPGRGRMVPDVAANADPNTGYEIVIYGAPSIVGGTSAVAPLYAGLFAAFGIKLGFVTPQLWAIPNRHRFTDIMIGGNGEFWAKHGPDPCSGLGSPNGSKLSSLFTTAKAAE